MSSFTISSTWSADLLVSNRDYILVLMNFRKSVGLVSVKERLELGYEGQT